MEGVVQFGDQMLLSTGDFRQGRRVSINARTAPRWAAGMADRSMAGAVCMSWNYRKTPVKTRKTNPLVHSDAGRRACLQRLDLAPVQPGKQRLELGMVQRKQPIFDRWSGEASPFSRL